LVAVLPIASSAASTSVPPTTYEATVCEAIATAHAQNTTAVAALQTAAQAFKSQPGSGTATQLRQALADSLRGVQATIKSALTTIKQAGVPAVKNGKKFSDALAANLQGALAATAPLIGQTERIDVTNATRFATGFQQVDQRLQAAERASNQQAKREPAFQHAAPALHPLIVFLTTNTATCPPA
jgi:hypothetical protein